MATVAARSPPDCAGRSITVRLNPADKAACDSKSITAVGLPDFRNAGGAVPVGAVPAAGLCIAPSRVKSAFSRPEPTAMFTGIVAATGKITTVTPLEQGVRLAVDAGGLDMDDVAVGDSIACNGVCLTVVGRGARGFAVDVSRETLNCTVGLDGSNEVNLEKALRLADRLGGHLVSGHVDGVGEVLRFEPSGESRQLVIRAPRPLGKYIARKGSIAVDGVSLTTNAVADVADGTEFSINLIPHTVEVTTLRNLKAGSWVNLEIDLIARYVERIDQSENRP